MLCNTTSSPETSNWTTKPLCQNAQIKATLAEHSNGATHNSPSDPALHTAEKEVPMIWRGFSTEYDRSFLREELQLFQSVTNNGRLCSFGLSTRAVCRMQDVFAVKTMAF